ncbi:MAG: hypothetical protein Q9209_000088 [Squamulea sp. 1 TL-2023]
MEIPAYTFNSFYVNPPGVSPEEGCIWGSSEKPHGNWSPYVLGGNTVETGETFIKLGWNPIYLEPATPFRDEKPTFSVEIICDGDGCNGLPCAIDPSQHGVNELVGSSSVGAGGAASCVVTVPKGGSARYVVSECGSKGANHNSGPKEDKPEHKPDDSPEKQSPPPTPQPPPPPKSTLEPSTALSTSESRFVSSTLELSTTSSISSSKIEGTPTPMPTPSSSSSASSTSSSTPTSTSTASIDPASSETSTSTSTSTTFSSSTSTSPTSETSTSSAYTAFAPVHIKAHISKPLKYTYKPHVFADNSTAPIAAGSNPSAGLASTTASASQGSGTVMPSPPVSQPLGSSASYTHFTAAAFGLTALAAFAVAAF